MKQAFAKTTTALAILTAAAGAAPVPAAFAAPAASHWTVIDLGTLGGAYSGGNAINNAGQVTGYAYTASETPRAFLYSNGTMTELITPGGDSSVGLGINDIGQVTGSVLSEGGDRRGFLYSDGASTDLGTFGGSSSSGKAINNAGQVTGNAATALNMASRAFLYSGGRLRDLGTLGGTNSEGNGINNVGQIAGSAYISGNAGVRAFLLSNGVMTDLGTLGGGSSFGNAINNAGQITGASRTSGNAATHAFLYSNGAMTGLGTLGGDYSEGLSINSAGLVTGYSTNNSGASRAFLYSNGAMRDLNSFNGIAGSGLTLADARGINDVGQITGTTSSNRAYLATLDTVVWESNTSGQWDATTGWSHGINPNKNTAVFIDPLRDLTVTGPAGAVTLRSLNVGGDATGNNGIATLDLAGGVITVTGLAESTFGTVISDKGVLSGNGVITGSVLNRGTVNATNLTMLDGLVSTGTLTGHGRLTTNLDNAVGGTLQLGAGQRLLVSGISHSSEGTVQIERGAELRVVGAFTHNSGADFNLVSGSSARFFSSASNAGDINVSGASSLRFDDILSNRASGRIVIDNGTIRFNGGISNAGQLLVSYGGANIYGPVTTVAGGQVILSANSNSAFFGTVEVQQGGELRVTSGSTATFFGEVLQRTGSVFSGSGRSIYEGGLSIGASPGLGINEGDVTFGRNGVYLAEIGGVTACTEACATDEAFKNSSFDKYIVKGRLTLGGQLKLASWNDFVAQVGMSFDLLDWGSVDGTFSSIDASGLRLASGAQLDLSRLYTTGTISVMAAPAVPEPSAWVLALAGVGGLLGRRLSVRRRQ